MAKSLQDGRRSIFSEGLGKRSRALDAAFIGPVFIIYTLLFIYPFLQGLVYSFSAWDGIAPKATFVGFRNFIEMFTKDEYFVPSLNRTFFIAFVNVFFTNLLAMLFALALTNNFRFNNFWRAAIFMPNVISMVVSGFIWKFMFNEIAENMAEATGMEVLNQSWLGDPSIVAYSIVIVSVWWGLGYIMTIYIAGLQGIDSSIVEAAEIDGCSTWQMFFRIKLPSMLPVVTVGVFLNVSGSLKIFDTIYSLTGGGPGKASEVAMLNIYREAFVYGRLGYGNAKAVVLTIIILAITAVQMKLTSGKERA
jgi:raffinose/stachyose/melibiose transport system permease protein